MADAGSGERTAAARHKAGMLAVLRGEMPGSAHLDLELPSPGSGGYRRLIDIRRLEAYFESRERAQQ
jgi:hypothetical protein